MKPISRLLLPAMYILMFICLSGGITLGGIMQYPAFQYQSLAVAAWSDPANGDGDLLVDNFEYWDSPCNHGWRQVETYYPVYGFGTGYVSVFQTVIDFQGGSRVLDVYRPPSIFLINTPYEKHGITYDLYTPMQPGSNCLNQGIDLSKTPVLSFKFRAPIGIELFDIFEFNITGTTRRGYRVLVRILPLEPCCSCPHTHEECSEYHIGNIESRIVDADIPSGSMSIQVNIGRDFLDGFWHVAWIDIYNLIEEAMIRYDGEFGEIAESDWKIVRAEKIGVYGQMFRIDDIIFRVQDLERLGFPNLMETGPMYAQIFEPYRYLFMADYDSDGRLPQVTDLLLEPSNFITDTDKIRDIWIADLLRLDPNYHVINPSHPLYDPEYTHIWIPEDPNFGKPDPVAEKYLGKGFFIDCTLPVFSDQNFRINGAMAAELKAEGMLEWNVTVGGYGHNAIQSYLIQPLPINPYDGMPTYIFTHSSCISVIETYGRPHYGPNESFVLESALWNCGLALWPNISYIDIEAQYFEDLILTIEVTNGIRSDIRAFPLSVVNYPVENYPPVAQLNITRKAFFVGEESNYAIKFTDPDCFVFSLAQFYGRNPSTTHLPMLPGNKIREDQDNLTYTMIMNGLPSYQYGPWIEDMIDPQSGLITFNPLFEGIFEPIVICFDDRGASAFGSVKIYFVNQGTWFNHCPIIYINTSKPVVIKAGEEFILSPKDLNIIDPDGDTIYASSNIGAIGRTCDGGFIWTFQTNFPGRYTLELFFYDLRGGRCTRTLPVEVVPWWSF
ncbi:hypothetical protein JXL19_02575 [bacterium]|nr:hypothetical protein [bacterium]